MRGRLQNIFACRPSSSDGWDVFAPDRVSELGASIADESVNIDLGGLRQHFARAFLQLPRVLDEQQWHPDRIKLKRPQKPTQSAGYSITGWTTWVLAVPHAGAAVVLVADFEADLNGCVELLNDCFYRRRGIRIRLDGPGVECPLVEGLARRLKRRGESLGALTLDLDAHQLLILDDGAALSAPSRFPDMSKVRKVVFRGEPARADWGPPRMPIEANRPPEALVVVDESVTLAVAADEPMTHGFLVCAALSVCGMSRCREIRSRAHSMLRETSIVSALPHQDVSEKRERLTGLSHQLSTLEIDLSFGVHGNADIGAILPVNQVAGYHRELVEAISLQNAASVTTHLLERLSRSISAAADAAAGEERARSERFQRRLAIAGAVLVAPSLATGIFGANVEGLPGGSIAIWPWLVATMLAFTFVTLLLVFAPTRRR